MATRRNSGANPPAPPDGDEQLGEQLLVGDEDLEVQTAADRVLHMLTDVAGDDRAKMTVHQVLPNGKEAWCEDYSPHDYELGGMKMIRDRWGAGNFKVRLYGSRDGHFGILTSATIVVKESREPPAAAAAPNNDALRLIAEGQQQMLRALTERPAADPMADMVKMFGMMKLMREAMGLDGAPARTERSSVGELVDAIKELRGAAELITPNAGGDDHDSLMGMAKAFLPMIATMAGNRRAGAGQVQQLEQLQAPGAFEAGGPEPAGSVVDTTTAGPITTWPALHDVNAPAELPTGNDVPIITTEALTAFKLKAYLSSLVMLARNKASADKGAELVYAKLPDEWIDMLDLPTWWELFSQACPDAIPYQAWFTEVRDKSLQLFAEDDAADESASTSTASSSKAS